MRDSCHFSVGELGFVLGCMGLGVAISEIVWGNLTETLGDKAVIVTGLTLMGVIFLSWCRIRSYGNANTGLFVPWCATDWGRCYGRHKFFVRPRRHVSESQQAGSKC
jgi:predicted MFS family arabinose efflux permease